MNGALRIPISEVLAYAEMHDFGRRRRREFLIYIEALDKAFLGHIKQQQADNPRPPQATPRPQPQPQTLPGRRAPPPRPPEEIIDLTPPPPPRRPAA